MRPPVCRPSAALRSPVARTASTKRARRSCCHSCEARGGATQHGGQVRSRTAIHRRGRQARLEEKRAEGTGNRNSPGREHGLSGFRPAPCDAA